MTGGISVGLPGPGTGTGTGTDSSDAADHGTGDESAGGEGTKLDVNFGDESTAGCAGDSCQQTGCVAVDLLFVIDNSSSMEPYQAALAEAFPSFARAIVDGLPAGVNIHVGVTSTEMGFSSSGMNTISYVNDEAVSCEATGDDDQPSDAFYQTPASDPTDTNGAQGRLYENGGARYFDIDAAAAPDAVADLETWFSNAAQIGEFGSQVEMSMAAAAWATDPVNEATNAGFLRDKGAVLVLFFIQDEHDQTPTNAAESLLDKIRAAKQECGGFECIVGGGFVNEDCLPLTPLGALFDAIGEDVITATLPAPAAVSPETFEAALRDTLAQVIIDTCDQIEPPA